MMLGDRVKPLEHYRLRIPGNGINQVGIDAIRSLIYGQGVHSLQRDNPNWEWVWRIGGKGEYVGTLSKRLAKWAYQVDGIKIDSETMAEIGNLGNENCDKAKEVYFDFTQDFGWNKGDFGDHGSCFFAGCRARARELMSRWGCWAMRFYENDTYTQGIGRVWVIDYPEYCVTLNGYERHKAKADESRDYVENGYSTKYNHGPEHTMRLSRVLAQFLGNAYYHRLTLTCDTETMYLNGGFGVAIGPQDLVAPMDDHALAWRKRDGSLKACCVCNELCNERLIRRYEEKCYCPECFTKAFRECHSCGHWHPKDSFVGEIYCASCYQQYFTVCESCKQVTSKRDVRIYDGKEYCTECVIKLYAICSECGGRSRKDSVTRHGGKNYCKSCFQAVFTTCDCGAICNLLSTRKFHLYHAEGKVYYLAPDMGVTTLKSDAHAYTNEEANRVGIAEGFKRVYIPSKPVKCPTCKRELAEAQ